VNFCAILLKNFTVHYFQSRRKKEDRKWLISLQPFAPTMTLVQTVAAINSIPITSATILLHTVTTMHTMQVA
jgi:hypothetical protein